MPHVFVSYVHEDNDKVDRLCSDLRSHGVKVWRASEKIDPGERWEREIKKAIKGGAFFIACFSRNYQKKDQSYMNKELDLAIKALSLRPLDKRWFIPVSLDGCEIPDLSIRHDETLRSLQKVDLQHNWGDGIDRIARSILNNPPRQAQARSKPKLGEDEYEEAMARIRRTLNKYIPGLRLPLNLEEIIDEAAKESAFKIKPTRAIIFGHVGVGKTTTINSLLESDIFPASGQLSCTRSLAAAQHRDGLIFYDSPGIGDDPEPENITRVALGIGQREEFKVDTIRLLDITETNQEGPKNYKKLALSQVADKIAKDVLKSLGGRVVGKEFTIKQFQLWQARHPFDFAVFMMSSEKGLSFSDTELMKSLHAAHAEASMKIFKVFNILHDRYRPDEDELDSGIRNIFIQAKDRLRKAGLKDCDEWIIVDAKSGSGMEAFVESFADSLPVEALKNLANTLKREYAHVIQRKIDEHYLDFLAQITALVAVFPADHSAGRERLLNLALDSLMTVAEFMSPEKEAREARPLVLQIIGQIESKSTRRTYDRVKQYRWREMPKFISDFFGLYEWKNVKVDEYYGVGGINAIRLVLALGLAVRELFRGHPADRLESLLQSSRMRIERAVDGNADSINRVTRTAGRQFDKDTRIQLSEELYPLIRQILTEELGSHTPS